MQKERHADVSSTVVPAKDEHQCGNIGKRLRMQKEKHADVFSTVVPAKDEH